MPSDFLWAQSEVVRTKVFPKFYTAKWNMALDLIKRGEVEQIGERDYRIPFELSPGGDFGTYDPNFGDMGRGSAAKGDKFVSSFYNVALRYELPHLADMATEKGRLSVKKVFKDTVKGALPEMMLYLDKTLHSNGTAVLATAISQATVSGATEYTLDTNIGPQLLRRNMPITVYNNALSTQKDTTRRISWIDFNTRKIRLTGTVPSAANDDKITFAGVAGSSPAGFKGLDYYISESTSGSTLGITRANEPEIVSSYVNVSSAAITVEHGMFLLHKMLNRRGELADEMVGLAGTAQQAAIYSDLIALQNMDIANSNRYLDRLPAGLRKKSFVFCTVPHTVDIHQANDRILWLLPSTWGRAVLKDISFFQNPGSDMRFFPLYGGSGAPAAGVWFAVTCDHDYYCVDPGGQGLLYNVGKPTLYQ